MVQKEEKYVVLVGAPCGVCLRQKTEALRPLLQEPNLRVWSQFVTDIATAEELLGTGGSYQLPGRS